MQGQKILIVDDEERMRRLLNDFLTLKGFDVVEAKDGEEALEIFYKERDLSLIILDVMMPKLSGWDVLRTIRSESRIPVIMLTAKGEEQDELMGFRLGGDEYITKPFSPKILTARVEALLRRSGSQNEDKVTEGLVTFDRVSHTVTADGRIVELSFKEFELLDYFIHNKNIALSRENILNNVWDYDYFGDSRTIDTHVKKLRAKLGAAGSQIKTIWGMGYKFTDEP